MYFFEKGDIWAFLLGIKRHESVGEEGRPERPKCKQRLEDKKAHTAEMGEEESQVPWGNCRELVFKDCQDC